MHLRTADTLLLHTSESRTDVLEHWSLCSFVKYCMNPVDLCFRSKEVTRERRGAAMETRQI